MGIMMPRALTILVVLTVVGAATTAWSSYRSQKARTIRVATSASSAASAPTRTTSMDTVDPIKGVNPSQVTPVGARVQPARKNVPAHRPAATGPAVNAGVETYHGIPATVSCATCHSTIPENRATGQNQTLPAAFHAGLKYQHGSQSCLNCHNADNYDTLRLANGSAVQFSQAQQLCSQCHGPQTRDYLHGTHGGMTGYWDTTRGARQRNTCTDCHDPHSPAFPAIQPVFPPRDRGALQQAARAAAGLVPSPSPSQPSTP
jgi:hypothetical protein